MLATGSREATAAERLSDRVCISGHRPARLVFLKNVPTCDGIEKRASFCILQGNAFSEYY
jgi:hypothetical protein